MFIIIFTMITIYMYSYLLSALSFVEMKILNIKGRVGGRVSFKCSDWDSLSDVTSNDKYFCKSPCTKDEHIIIKAAPGKSTQGNRTHIFTRGKDLFVTFTNLEKSDSKTYYCGVDRFGPDTYIKVILTVTEAEPSIPKKTPETVDTFTTLSSAVSNISTPSSNSYDNITDVSVSNTTINTTATQGAGSIPYLILGVILIITILMVLLKLMSKMMMRQRKVVSTAVMPQEDAPEEAEYDEIRNEEATDPDSLYANHSFLQDIGSAAARCETNSRGACAESRDNVLYCVAQLPKDQIKPTGQPQRNQSESAENDSFYDLAQLPQAP